MVEWIKQYAVPLIGGLVGLVFAILFLSIGFFKTLLVVLLTGLGIWLGLYLEQTGIVKNYFHHICAYFFSRHQALKRGHAKPHNP